MKKIKMLILALAISIFPFSAFCEGNGKKPVSEFVPYHGKRMTADSSEFSVSRIHVRNISNGENELLEIMIRFSNPVDPRSVKSENILLNGIKCGSNAFIRYGRNGESLKIAVFSPEEKLKYLELNEIKSFNGVNLSKTRYDADDSKFFFMEKSE